MLSVLLTIGATAIDAQPPPKFPSPLTQYLWPLVAEGGITIEGVPIAGPVSANPIGTYEPWYYRLFPPGSEPVVWSSFNLGELLWPQSLASLLPVLLVLAAGCVAVRRLAPVTPGASTRGR